MSNFINSLKDALIKIDELSPVVHHITNLVTINSCANATTALGASPVMASCKEEVAEITALSSSLVLNLGTPDSERFISAKLAGKAANIKGIPIVLDPVGVGSSSFRKDNINALLEEVKPSVIKGNLAEIKTLAGLSLENNKAIDSGEKDDGNLCEIAKATSKKFNCTVVMTGKEDIIADGEKICRINRGTEMFTYISGAGCITSSVIGSFLSVEKDTFKACAYALYSMNICGEQASKESKGSGDFYISLLNNLFSLKNTTVEEEGIHFE